MAKSTGVIKPGSQPGQKPRAQSAAQVSSTASRVPSGASATLSASTAPSTLPASPTPTVRATSAPATQTPVAVSTANTKLVFVGDAIQGQAAQLLDRMIEAMGVARQEVSILTPEAANALELTSPHLFVALGEKATQALLQSGDGLATLRSQFHSYRGSKLMAVFHPAELIKSPQLKKDVWTDLQKVVKELGITLPKK